MEKASIGFRTIFVLNKFLNNFLVLFSIWMPTELGHTFESILVLENLQLERLSEWTKTFDWTRQTCIWWSIYFGISRYIMRWKSPTANAFKHWLTSWNCYSTLFTLYVHAKCRWNERLLYNVLYSVGVVRR